MRRRKNDEASEVPPSGSPAIAPRLLDEHQAAQYLGCGWTTVRDWISAGILPTVDLPALPAREGDRPKGKLRRRLVDRLDLDAFIESRKQGSASVLQSSAPQNGPVNTGRNRASVPEVCPPGGLR